MSDAYDNVVGGGLKLKGIGKKKKKDKEAAAASAAKIAAAEAEKDAAAAEVAETAAASSSSSVYAGHTGAEMRRLQIMQERKIKKLEKGEVKTHRDQVQEFNTYLSKLTEHYDLPKVHTHFAMHREHPRSLSPCSLRAHSCARSYRLRMGHLIFCSGEQRELRPLARPRRTSSICMFFCCLAACRACSPGPRARGVCHVLSTVQIFYTRSSE